MAKLQQCANPEPHDAHNWTNHTYDGPPVVINPGPVEQYPIKLPGVELRYYGCLGIQK